MNYFKNFIAVAVLSTTLFAGQALESAKIRIKDKEWGEAEKYLLEALIIQKINGKQHFILVIKYTLENRTGHQLKNIWILHKLLQVD